MSTNGNATIAFRVADNGISSFMDGIRRKADTMSNDIIRAAQNQTKSAKEQEKIIQEQIKLLERKLSIERNAALEQAKVSRDNRLARIDDYNYNQISGIQQKVRNKEITRKEGTRQIEDVQGRVAEARDRVAENFSTKNDAINSSYREVALTNQLLRQNIDTARATSREQLNQMRRGDESIVNAVDETAQPLDRFVNQHASQQFEEERVKDKDKDKEGKGKEQWLQFVKALAFDRVGGLVASTPGMKNELDFIKPLTSIVGTAIGGLAGVAADAIANINGAGFGTKVDFSSLGTGLGAKAGEFFGTALERSYKSRDELTSANYQLQALTGKNLGIENIGGENGLGGRGFTKEQINNYDLKSNKPQGLERYGVDFAQGSELMYQSAQRTGYSRNMQGNAENVLAAQQGLGVTKETSFALMEMQRTSKEGDKDFLRTLGGILQEGTKGVFKEDRTFLNEFVSRNFITLQRELLKTNTRVHSGTTMDILQSFNSINHGNSQWAARDPRSLGLISQVQQSLSNPQSDNTKALAFSVMRKLHPEDDFYKTQQRIQHGLAEPGYAKSMKSALDQIGGEGSAFAKYNFASVFGLKDDLDASEELYNDPSKVFKDFSRKDLKGTGALSEEGIRDEGQKQTSIYSQKTAQIQDRFVDDVAGAIKFVGGEMKSLFGDMTVELKKYIMSQIWDKNDDDDKKPKQNLTVNGLNLRDPQQRRTAVEAGDFGSKE